MSRSPEPESMATLREGHWRGADLDERPIDGRRPDGTAGGDAAAVGEEGVDARAGRRVGRAALQVQRVHTTRRAGGGHRGDARGSDGKAPGKPCQRAPLLSGARCWRMEPAASAGTGSAGQPPSSTARKGRSHAERSVSSDMPVMAPPVCPASGPSTVAYRQLIQHGDDVLRACSPTPESLHVANKALRARTLHRRRREGDQLAVTDVFDPPG